MLRAVAATPPGLQGAIGRIPYRLQMAGGWIDQPFVSRLNPEPPGSMVVVSLEPTVRYMDRSGMATGTRVVAQALWGDELPAGPAADLVRELYRAENAGRDEPSGSQDMCGLVYPGISRLDYDAAIDGGWFPAHIELTSVPQVVAWLERVIHLVPVGGRPARLSTHSASSTSTPPGSPDWAPAGRPATTPSWPWTSTPWERR